MKNDCEKPIKIAVTGAAGQIGYSILFRILNGEMLGNNKKISLQLIGGLRSVTGGVIQASHPR